MEKQKDSPSVKNDETIKSTCNVNSAFNFTVGAIAIAVAGLIGYFIYQCMIM
jgi:hypothetical protein